MNHPHAPQTFGGDPTPLHCSAAVAALWHAWGDANAVLSVLHAVPTWGELIALGQSSRVGLIGPVLSSVPLPEVCPPPPDLPGGGRAVTPYDMDFPSALDPVRWPVLYVRGHLPAGRAVLVGGSSNPSPQGVEIARSAALAAAGDRVPLVAVLTEGVGLVAVRTAAAAGGRVIVVVPHSLEQYSQHQSLLDEVCRAGGAVVTHLRAGTPSSAWAADLAAVLAVGLAHSVVIAETGTPPGHAATLTRATVEAERYLIAPAPPEHHVPTSALGLTVLTQPRMFTAAWYGSSPRVMARLAAGLPAADVVVSDQAQISAAIRQSCPKDTTAL